MGTVYGSGSWYNDCGGTRRGACGTCDWNTYHTAYLTKILSSKIIVFFSGILVGTLLTLLSIWLKQPFRPELLEKLEDVPFVICIEDPTWTRPTVEQQMEHLGRDPRYRFQCMQYLLSHPIWKNDFLQYPGGASAEGMMKILGGLWSARFVVREDNLCRNRQRDVSIGHQAEIWLKYHQIISLKRRGHDYFVEVEPANRGFQAVDFLRPDRCPISFYFDTPQGEPIFYMSEKERLRPRETSLWGDKCPR
jgi:hypothetical protein